MPDDWQFTVKTLDVRGESVEGARLVVTVWTGGATTDRRAEVVVNGVLSTTVPDTAVSVVLELHHDRYAPLALALVRDPTESVWRWTDPRREVQTSGRQVVVLATLSRVRAMPTGFRREDELKRSADAAMAEAVAARRGRPPPPTWAMVDGDLRVALTSQDRATYRSQAGSLGNIGNGGKISAFHVTLHNRLERIRPLRDGKDSHGRPIRSTLDGRDGSTWSSTARSVTTRRGNRASPPASSSLRP